MDKLFLDTYKNKRVLVTGHTGFKGSWLTNWLIALKADVTGYSAYFPSDPCHFEAAGLDKKINHITGDVRDSDHLNDVFSSIKPEVVFHLAAQPIVRRSYDEPKLTFDTNIGGTINIFEAIRKNPSVKAAVIITSDKCYQNNEWSWGYRENDRLGGEDPYSASKACAEIVSNSYIKSFFNNDSCNISTVRAGNVIGGGDWGDNRIIPDCVKSWANNEIVNIRSPKATRPWQHVLEPLSGYLWLGSNLLKSKTLHGEAFNFGPDVKVNQSVEELINQFSQFWENAKWENQSDNSRNDKESGLLKLSCDKALHYLQWHPVLDFEKTIQLTAQWYKSYYEQSKDIREVTLNQIEYYTKEALKQKLIWTQ